MTQEVVVNEGSVVEYEGKDTVVFDPIKLRAAPSYDIENCEGFHYQGPMRMYRAGQALGKYIKTATLGLMLAWLGYNFWHYIVPWW